MKPELLPATFVEMCVRYEVNRIERLKYIHFHLQIFSVGHEGRLHEVSALKCASSCKLTSDAHTAVTGVNCWLLRHCMKFVWLPIIDVTDVICFH
jgi:hypothetical protein